ANTAAGRIFQPKLSHQDHSYTTIVYDRQERTELAIAQGEFVEKEFIKPHQTVLNALSTQTSL
ncbi:MAG: putative oxygenase MesX, partial [Pseudomonadota bacterium]|nr:putative oxygenase MesX [Pseudomonadota bacterium]